MSKWNKGDRVGVMLGANQEFKEILFLGYGEYIGETVPPEHIGGFNFGMPNPTLKLDNGKICYGCETYWGTEAGMQKRISEWKAAGYKLTVVDIDFYREKCALF